MTETFYGCKFSTPFASPKNWKTTTSNASLKKDWFVQCEFYDPERGTMQFRRRINRIKSLRGRKEAITLLLNEIPKLLLERGYNPITKSYMVVENQQRKDIRLDGTMRLDDAIELSVTLAGYTGDTLKDVKSIIKYFLASARQLKYDHLPVNSIIGVHVDIIMENLIKYVRKLSDKRYNKYLVYLHRLFGVLKKKGIIKVNPLEEYEKKKTFIEPRKTLSLSERAKIDKHLKLNYPSFWLFVQLFFHSGCREVELLRVKYEDVDLDNLKLRVLVLKGTNPKHVYLPIKKIAVDLWSKALINAKKGDYIFSQGLIPGPHKIRRDQITRRWREHVKKKLNIDADIYSLKHSNLTEISERRSVKEAAKAAGHTTTTMVKKHYDVNYKEREMNGVRTMTNEFAPSRASNTNTICNSPSFQFVKLGAAI